MYNKQNTDALIQILKSKDGNFPQQSIKEIKRLIREGADPRVTDGSIFQNTLLANAIVDGDVDLALFLIEHDKAQDSLKQSGDFLPYNTPLMLAIKKGHYDIACKLIEKHACPDLKDRSTLSPLHIAILTFGGSVEKVILSRSNKNNFFSISPISHKVPIEEQKQLIQKLIEDGTYLEAKDDFGKTPMEYLNQPLSIDDLYNIIPLISLGDFLVLQKDNPILLEKEALLGDFYKRRRAIEDSDLFDEEYDSALFELYQSSDRDVTNYLNFKEKPYTPQQIIDNPIFKVNSFEDIKNSQQFLVSFNGKGGELNISQKYGNHMEGHQNFKDLIESRNAYLQTPDCVNFFNELNFKSQELTGPKI